MNKKTKTGWYCCPHCGKKLLKHTREASARGFYIKCRRCGKEIEVRI